LTGCQVKGAECQVFPLPCGAVCHNSKSCQHFTRKIEVILARFLGFSADFADIFSLRSGQRQTPATGHIPSQIGLDISLRPAFHCRNGRSPSASWTADERSYRLLFETSQADRDKSLTGELNMKKFLAIVLATGFASTAALAADFTAVDADQNGSVSMEEAKAAMPDMADDAFKAADGDQNGELSADEWAAIQG
jgi:hypothetical protein